MAVTSDPPQAIPRVLQDDSNDSVKVQQIQWALRKNNVIRKVDSKVAASCKPKKRLVYHKNAFHLDLRNKWSKLVTNKISALAFQRSLRGHKCSG